MGRGEVGAGGGKVTFTPVALAAVCAPAAASLAVLAAYHVRIWRRGVTTNEDVKRVYGRVWKGGGVYENYWKISENPSRGLKGSKAPFLHNI